MDRQEYRDRLAGRLRGARAEAALTQKQVEAGTGISSSHLSRVEHGLEEIGLEELLVLAGLYDVALERLLDQLVPLGDPPTATRASSNGEPQAQPA